MRQSLNRILIKIFVAGFYRAHAGLILSLFVTFFIYFFFTAVLNQTHITQREIVLYNLKLVLTSVSNPVFMGLMFIIWLFYTIKSVKYVASQLSLADQQFLFYSSNSIDKTGQFKSWFLVQSIISLPLIIPGAFAMLIGFLFQFYIIPAIIPIYLLALISGSSFYYLRLLNLSEASTFDSAKLPVARSWPKPLFSLFLYQIIYNLKLNYGITKLISVVIITGIYAVFKDQHEDLRIAEIVILAIVTGHSILISQSHDFERNYLRFSLNFPNSRFRIYLHSAILFTLLLLPELVWLFIVNGIFSGVKSLLLGLSIALLFRSLLYGFCHTSERYLRTVFAIFVLYALAILFGLFWSLLGLNFLVSFSLFYIQYHASLDR